MNGGFPPQTNNQIIYIISWKHILCINGLRLLRVFKQQEKTKTISLMDIELEISWREGHPLRANGRYWSEGNGSCFLLAALSPLTHSRVPSNHILTSSCLLPFPRPLPPWLSQYPPRKSRISTSNSPLTAAI